MKILSTRRVLAAGAAIAFALSSFPHAVALAADGGAKSITTADLKAWLATISSDEFEGRATFSEGLGLAGAYIAGELKSMGVKPGGDHGSYFQRVAVLGVKATSRNTLTVTVNGQSRTFKDGEGFNAAEERRGEADLLVRSDRVRRLRREPSAPQGG
jgi:hypothetical protein